MRTQVLIENLTAIAESPLGVDAVRRAVLHQALRGELTQKDPTHGSVHDELRSISSALTPSKIVEPFPESGGPWSIPAHWMWVRLKQIADFAPGKTPPTKDASMWAEPDQGHPWASIADMPESGVLLQTTRSVTPLAIEASLKRQPAAVGALLMSFKLTIGKVCRVGIPTFFNEAIVEITPARQATGDYLFAVLPILATLGDSKAAIKGKTLNKSSITNIPIPLPPLAEQELLVAKVDELMELCDELEARQEERRRITISLRDSSLDALTSAETDEDLQTAWSRVSDNWSVLAGTPDAATSLEAATIELALRGRLSKRLRDDRPVDVSLADAKRAQAELMKPTDLKKVDGLAPAAPAYAIPTSWKWIRLGAVVTSLNYGTAKKCHLSLSEGSPVLRIPNLDVDSNGFDLGEIKYAELTPQEEHKLAVEVDDLLLVRSNGSTNLVGRSVVVDSSVAGMMYAGYLMRLRVTAVNPSFIRLALESRTIRQQIEGPIRTTSGVKNVNTMEILSLQLPLPPLEEQARIVQTVASLSQECAALDAAMVDASQQQELLTSVIAG